MATVAGENRGQQQEIEDKHAPPSWLKWGLMLAVGVGCYVYFSQFCRRPQAATLSLPTSENKPALPTPIAYCEPVSLVDVAPAAPAEPIDSAAQIAEPAVEDDPVDEGKININTATFDMLDSLPGVGTVTAHAIVEYREAHGGFQSLDELRKVRGIGQEKFRWLESLVTI